MTPAQEVQESYTSWDEFEAGCSQSRLYGGLHFQQSLDVAREMCAPLGTQCYETSYKLFMQSTTSAPISHHKSTRRNHPTRPQAANAAGGVPTDNGDGEIEAAPMDPSLVVKGENLA